MKTYKKTLSIIPLLAGAVGAYAQGQINWSDYQTGQGGFEISIISPNPATPTVEQTGNTDEDLPAGSSVYGGGRIGGAYGHRR
jgi:hypothetical protein